MLFGIHIFYTPYVFIVYSDRKLLLFFFFIELRLQHILKSLSWFILVGLLLWGRVWLVRLGHMYMW